MLNLGIDKNVYVPGERKFEPAFVSSVGSPKQPAKTMIREHIVTRTFDPNPANFGREIVFDQ